MSEVRSVGSGIDTVDDDIVVAMEVREEAVIRLHVGTIVRLQLHCLLTWIDEGALLLLGEEVTILGRSHAGRSIAGAVGTEIESLE